MPFPGPSRARLFRSVVPLRAEAPRLILLVVLIAAGFIATRAVAGHERQARVRDAAEWQRRGADALERGRAAEAIGDFRRAVTKDRGSRSYQLQLATALASDGQLDGAQRVLLALRDRAPDDPQLNLQLARVEVRRGDETAAVRFYRSALYAPWPEPAGPLQVRLELAAFLLGHGRRSEAVSELIAAAAGTTPDDITTRRSIGRLLLDAGDPAHALETLQAVLRVAPDDAGARATAGTAAFDLGRYGLAASYFDGLALDAGAADKRALADAVLARDPLAPRLGAVERRRRAVANLRDVTSKIDACRSAHGGDEAAAALDASLVAVAGAKPRVQAGDRDAIEDSLAAIAGAENTLARYCGQPDRTDRALAIVAGLHGETP
jgi:tetratricopeptide (TPR) repeat protein